MLSTSVSAWGPLNSSQHATNRSTGDQAASHVKLAKRCTALLDIRALSNASRESTRPTVVTKCGPGWTNMRVWRDLARAWGIVCPGPSFRGSPSPFPLPPSPFPLAPSPLPLAPSPFPLPPSPFPLPPSPYPLPSSSFPLPPFPCSPSTSPFLSPFPFVLPPSSFHSSTTLHSPPPPSRLLPCLCYPCLMHMFTPGSPLISRVPL